MVQFSIYNVNAAGFNKKSSNNDPTIPQCSEELASYAIIKVKSINGIELHKLDIYSKLGQGNQTEVLKMYEGEYELLSFEVYSDDDTLIWNAVKKDSYYVKLWQLNYVDTTLTIEAFKKLKMNIDVMCYYKEIND